MQYSELSAGLCGKGRPVRPPFRVHTRVGGIDAEACEALN